MFAMNTLNSLQQFKINYSQNCGAIYGEFVKLTVTIGLLPKF